eukprot:590238-Rhodomonas_salina.4
MSPATAGSRPGSWRCECPKRWCWCPSLCLVSSLSCANAHTRHTQRTHRAAQTQTEAATSHGRQRMGDKAPGPGVQAFGRHVWRGFAVQRHGAGWQEEGEGTHHRVQHFRLHEIVAVDDCKRHPRFSQRSRRSTLAGAGGAGMTCAGVTAGTRALTCRIGTAHCPNRVPDAANRA